MLESKIQSDFIKKLKKDGYLVIKQSVTNMNGVPDLIAIKDGIASFYEIKQNNKTPEPLQIYTMKKIRCYGCKTYVWDGIKLIEYI